MKNYDIRDAMIKTAGKTAGFYYIKDKRKDGENTDGNGMENDFGSR